MATETAAAIAIRRSDVTVGPKPTGWVGEVGRPPGPALFAVGAADAVPVPCRCF
jgi:hypothetical protein